MIKITFPDASVREYEKGITGLEIAQSISRRLAQDALAVSVNGETWDLTRPIENDSEVNILTWDDAEGKHAYWHSSAHLMAEALQELYPGIKFGIGPAIENGFYYDVDPGEGVSIKEADFPVIEKKMMELIAAKEDIIRKSISKTEAVKMFSERDENYKVELINELEDGTITTYTQGSFTDLCRGPHLPNTSYIKAVKVLSAAGAYWRGDEKRPQLTRLYGITFPKKKLLDEYLVLLEEAKKRDHRKIGKELQLFTFSQTVGSGLPLWLPKGTQLRLRLEDFLKKIQRDFDYDQVITPHIGHKQLYVTSGHYAKYGQDSFKPIQTPEEGEEFLLKPMNCPHHCEIYKTFPHSYKDLPLRLAEFGTVYRYEQSGELHGLTRVRGFTQDDAHIFCTPDQVKDEFLKVVDIIFIIFNALNFKDFEAQISLRDPNNRDKYIGTDENWEKAERAIIEACEEKGLKTKIELGEAYFNRGISRDDIDAVVIATPDHWHAFIAIQACNAKKDVYLEKPLTFTIKEGQELVKAVRANGVILAVGSQQRSDINFQYAVRMVQEGRLGNIERVNAYVGAPPTPWEEDSQPTGAHTCLILPNGV
jgi:threonyl-tRNA synthetase